MIARLRRWLDHLRAFTRADLDAVCRLSDGRGLLSDYHDYPDSTTPHPRHLDKHQCRRCGKRFYI